MWSAVFAFACLVTRQIDKPLLPPVFQASERLAMLQQTYKQKQQQLHAMESDLIAQKGVVQDQKRELEFLQEELSALETRFLRRAKV
jgi:hypothetical protein